MRSKVDVRLVGSGSSWVMLVENDDSRPYIGRDSIDESVAEAGRSRSRLPNKSGSRAGLPRKGTGGVWPGVKLGGCSGRDKILENSFHLGPYRLVVKSSRCGRLAPHTSP